jgi:LysR family transcriptional regulator (chromosome initiation inhibitor)
MQLQHLETLAAVLDEGTFEAAARRLHVTASAVSQRVKAMEEEAGQVLVQRGTPARATAAGELIARYAKQVQLLGHDLDRSLGGAGGAPLLPVAVNADSLATWFLPALAAAHDRLGVMFDIHRDDQEYTSALLRSGQVMAAVTSEPNPVRGCTSTPLGLMRYRAVASPSFAARWMPAHDFAALAAAPVVDFDRKDGLQRAFLRARLGGDPAPPRHLVPTSADFARAVGFGLGWGMLPDQQSLAALASGDLVELAPEYPHDVALYWQRWNLDSPLLDEVSRLVREAAAASLRTPEA